jgi:phage FluMu protein Com
MFTSQEISIMEQPKKTLKNKMELIVCMHCNKEIIKPELSGLTLICPHCKKSVNGQYYHSPYYKERITRQYPKEDKKEV